VASLTERQARFVDEYLIDLNGTQAAIRAGYSPRTANEQASRLLTNVSVQELLQERSKDREARTQVNADYVLQRLVQIDQLDVADILDGTGNFLPVLQWPKVWRQTLSGMDVQEMITGDVESVIRKIKWPDKLRNLELLGKHVTINAFRDQVQVEVTGSLADRMAKARERASKG
jgi:phage terminase small subunit